MSKKPIELKPDLKMVKIFVFTTDSSAWGFDVVEIPEEVIKDLGRVVEKIQPDIFPVCENQLIRKAREVFGF